MSPIKHRHSIGHLRQLVLTSKKKLLVKKLTSYFFIDLFFLRDKKLSTFSILRSKYFKYFSPPISPPIPPQISPPYNSAKIIIFFRWWRWRPFDNFSKFIYFSERWWRWRPYDNFSKFIYFSEKGGGGGGDGGDGGFRPTLPRDYIFYIIYYFFINFFYKLVKVHHLHHLFIL